MQHFGVTNCEWQRVFSLVCYGILEHKYIKYIYKIKYIKLAWNYLFFSWSNKHLTTVKGRTWSRGTNSLLPEILISLFLARNFKLQVVIIHASHVCSQHSFGLPLRMNGTHRSLQLDHSHLGLLSLGIWYACSDNLSNNAQRWTKSVFIFHRCCPHSLTFGYF